MDIKSKIRIWSLAVVMTVSGTAGGAEKADSADCVPHDDGTRFTPAQLIVPGALIAVGAFGISNGWCRHVKDDVRSGMLKMSGNGRHKIRADEYLRFIPAAGYLAMGSIGVKSRHTFVERALVTATSVAAYGIMAGGLKVCVSERRPGDSNEYNSFPSGHTAFAFMGAELIRSEYSTGWGIGAYAVACGVGFMRLYNDRHWLNDVIAGAGVGILCARIGYWMLPVWRKVFHLDSPGCRTVMAMTPFYDVRSRGAGASFVSYF